MVDGFLGEHFAHVALAGWVADHTCAATKQRNRHVPSFLHPGHHHDLDKMAYMQAVCGWIETDVERNLVIIQQISNFFLICRLRDQTTRFQFVVYAHVSSSIFCIGGKRKRPLRFFAEGGEIPRYHLSLPHPHECGLMGTNIPVRDNVRQPDRIY